MIRRKGEDILLIGVREKELKNNRKLETNIRWCYEFLDQQGKRRMVVKHEIT